MFCLKNLSSDPKMLDASKEAIFTALVAAVATYLMPLGAVVSGWFFGGWFFVAGTWHGLLWVKKQGKTTGGWVYFAFCDVKVVKV